MNSFHKILFYWQILLCSTLTIYIGLTVSQISKIELPKISDRDLIFWLIEINR